MPGGSQFSVTISLDSLNLPDNDEDTNAGYLSFQVHVTNSEDLSQIDAAEQNEVVWPDCQFTAETRADDDVLIGCAIDFGRPPSTFTGTVVQLTYDCGPPGTTGVITLLHGTGVDSFVNDDFTGEHANDADAPGESLAVSCVEGTAWTPSATSPPPDRPLPTEVEVPPADTGGDNGTSPGLWVAIVAIVALAGLAVLGWRYRRPGARPNP